MSPIGYKYIKSEQGWKIVVKDDNYKIVKKWLEDYANHKLKTINELVLFLNGKWVKIWKVVNGKVYNSSLARRMLGNILYTGYIDFPKWKISKRKAQHDPIISMNTYNKIQENFEIKVNIRKK